MSIGTHVFERQRLTEAWFYTERQSASWAACVLLYAYAFSKYDLTRAVRAAVFHAGPSTQMNWFTNLDGDGTTTAAGNRGPTAMNGNAVMYEAGKILAVGGAPSFSQARLVCLKYVGVPIASVY